MSKLISIREAALLGVALFALATPAMAQDEAEGRRGRAEQMMERGDRPTRPEQAERQLRAPSPPPAQVLQRSAPRPERSDDGWRGRSEATEGQRPARVPGGDERYSRPIFQQRQDSAPPAPVAPPQRTYGSDRQSSYGAGQRDGSYGANERGRGWQRPQPQVETPPPASATPPRPSGVLRPHDGNRGDWQGRTGGDRREWRDRGESDRREWRGRDEGNRRDWQRERERREDARREERRDDWRNYSRGYRDGYRGDNRHYSSGYAKWNRHSWRNDRRYDWYRYRAANRSIFSPGRYYAPYRNYSYSRIGIGFRLGNLFYSNRYWIEDPWRYRLPDVYGPYRWVRYYDDAILVDIYSGEVIDVIYDFFW